MISIDLSGGVPPATFFIPLVHDCSLEEWRADETRYHDYTAPSSSWCAINDLWMLLELKGRRESRSMDHLFKAACEEGVYEWREDVHSHGPGWFGAKHEELAIFAASLGFEARRKKDMGLEDMLAALQEGWFIIANVHPSIRFPRSRSKPPGRTGHFVLVYGYRTRKDGSHPAFLVQNSAGFKTQRSQVGARISPRRMRQVFSGLALLVR